MTEEPANDRQPEPEEPSYDDAKNDAVEGEAGPRKSFLLPFPRAPIAGTELSIRSPSFGQVKETWKDVADDGIGNREFTVHLVQRQLDQRVPVEEVRSWPDEQLMAAAEGYLSLTTRESDLDDQEDESEAEAEGEASDDAVDGDQEADEVEDPAPEPLTFEGFRAEIRQQGLRRSKRMTKTIQGIIDLGKVNTAKYSELMELDPSLLSGLSTGAGVKAALDKINALGGVDAFKTLDLSKLTSIARLEPFVGLDPAKLAALSDTGKIGASLSKMMADQEAMERFSQPIQLPIREPEPWSTIDIVAPVRPEVGLLEQVAETLERTDDRHARTSDHQIQVMTEQATMLKNQGELLTLMLAGTKAQGELLTALLANAMDQSDATKGLLATGKEQSEKTQGLLDDAKGQKWTRWVMLAAAVAAALYASGILHPFGAAAPSTPAPIVNPSPVAPSPTGTPTPTLAPSPSPTSSSAPSAAAPSRSVKP